MQPQSVSSATPVTPSQGAPAPAVVGPRLAPPKPPRRGWIVALILIAAIVGGAYYWQNRAAAREAAAAAAVASVRTAKVTAGSLDSAIRLTGVTAAENFVSLVTPQLRGSRSGAGRDRQTVQQAAALPSLSSSGATASTNSSASAGSSSSGLSGALRSATSRVSTPSSSAASTATSSTSTTSSSAAMGADGLGSTASSLPPSGGGGGGGGSDFLTVLQKVVKPGSHVKKGDVVAEFDRQYMLLRLDDYHASVIQTKASLLKLKADLAITRHAHEQSIEKAKGVLEKARLDMKTVPVLSAIDAERTKLAVQDAEARYKELVSEAKLVETSLGSQIRNAELSLQQTEIELKRAQANADRMVVKAPIDGLTVMQTIPRGGDISPIQEGDQLYSGIFFMSIVDTRSMVINAIVNQADVERMRIGARARVRFDAYPDLELPARVYSVGGVAKPGGMRATFVKEIPIKLKLDRVEPRVIPDLSVSADVVIDSRDDRVEIAPRAAVFSDGPGQEPFVFVQTPAGWTRREVQLGLANNIFVEIRSGLKSGDTVAMERPPNPPPASGQRASAP